MYAYNYGAGSQIPQGHTHNHNPAYATASGYPANPAFVPPPGFVIVTPPAPAPSPLPVSGQTSTPNRTLTPRLVPVQVPPGCYPLELVQFCRHELNRSQSHPLHWALFVRTSPPTAPMGGLPARPRPGTVHQQAHGNFYELVGTPDTHTAQFFPGAFAPETYPDWRGTHVIGWVQPVVLGAFERAVRQVPVWRGRPEWRCQQWAYEVVCALGGGRCQGVYVDAGVTWAGMQRQMGRLLEAWESGDI
ncbi:hypothetical protein V8E55_004324 [Tylopilus felleus]